MYLTNNTLDGLLRETLELLLCQDKTYVARRGAFTEIFGACLHLTNPLARLSRSESKGKVFSALGEFLWYLSGETKLDFIDYYIPGRFQEESDDQLTVRSGYGDRLRSWRGFDQIENVIKVLKDSMTSRRAVIQLFDASDIMQHFASIPCTCTLQFLSREGRLHLFVAMRSNDALVGMPHDIFSFTMLQELIASSIGMELGEYKHCAGSLHLYQSDFDLARKYLKEGWQDPIYMPPMPLGDPWKSVKWLQSIEQEIRLKKTPVTNIHSTEIDEYWKDIGRMLLAFSASKKSDYKQLQLLKTQMHSDVYKMFLMDRYDRAEQIRMNSGVEM